MRIIDQIFRPYQGANPPLGSRAAHHPPPIDQYQYGHGPSRFHSILEGVPSSSHSKSSVPFSLDEVLGGLGIVGVERQHAHNAYESTLVLLRKHDYSDLAQRPTAWFDLDLTLLKPQSDLHREKREGLKKSGECVEMQQLVDLARSSDFYGGMLGRMVAFRNFGFNAGIYTRRPRLNLEAFLRAFPTIVPLIESWGVPLVRDREFMYGLYDKIEEAESRFNSLTTDTYGKLRESQTGVKLIKGKEILFDDIDYAAIFHSLYTSNFSRMTKEEQGSSLLFEALLLSSDGWIQVDGGDLSEPDSLSSALDALHRRARMDVSAEMSGAL